MTSEAIWVGIDVCKDMLDIYLLPHQESLQLPNTEAGIQKLVEQLQPLAPSRLTRLKCCFRKKI